LCYFYVIHLIFCFKVRMIFTNAHSAAWSVTKVVTFLLLKKFSKYIQFLPSYYMNIKNNIYATQQAVLSWWKFLFKILWLIDLMTTNLHPKPRLRYKVERKHILSNVKTLLQTNFLNTMCVRVDQMTFIFQKHFSSNRFRSFYC